jgi:hypothetical protein
MFDNFIANSEIIYRRIEASKGFYRIQTDGTIKIVSQAFSAREFNGEFRISVDRAKLCNNNPRHTLGTELGVVVSLVAEQVRKIDDITRNDSKGKSIQQFKIDIEPVPLPSNVAHAEIYAMPRFEKADQRGAFYRLCERLKRLAVIELAELSASE